MDCFFHVAIDCKTFDVQIEVSDIDDTRVYLLKQISDLDNRYEFGSIIARINLREEFQTDNPILGHESKVRGKFFHHHSQIAEF